MISCGVPSLILGVECVWVTFATCFCVIYLPTKLICCSETRLPSPNIGQQTRVMVSNWQLQLASPESGVLLASPSSSPITDSVAKGVIAVSGDGGAIVKSLFRSVESRSL